MKKIVWIFLLGGLLIAASGNAQTETAKEEKSQPKLQQRGQFTDSNQDGICDHWEQGKQRRRQQQFVDANNDGVCDNAQNGNRKGNGFRRGDGRGNANCMNGQGNDRRGAWQGKRALPKQ